MSINREKYFHGETHVEDRWNSTHYACCRLCKTKNSKGKYRHWAKGLCRSCYRRLSITHRLYNDKWNLKRKEEKRQRSRQSVGRKEYKKVDPKDIQFSDKDVDTLLERYNWCCAYSGTPLQGFAYTRGDAFQLEYITNKDGTIELVPVCRAINCSKKSLQTPEELKTWSEKIGIAYPFYYISIEEYELTL